MGKNLREHFESLLNRPMRVFWCCIALLIFSLLLEGTLIRLWRLHQDLDMSVVSIERVQKESIELENKLKQAQSPEFIEHEARDRFDYVGEEDLVFVFSDEG